MTIKAVLFDIDGTLVDSNDLHVDAWDEAFREGGFAVGRAAIRGQIGKGGDMLVPTLLPDVAEAAQKKLARRHGEIFQRAYLGAVRPFPDARALLERVHDAGQQVVLASSAEEKELDHYVALLDASAFVDATTSIDDVSRSKPAGDIFATALKKAGVAAEEAIVVGDTPYDIAAARACGIATVAVRSGGFSEEALAGAVARYDDVAALLAGYDASPLRGGLRDDPGLA